LQTANQLASVNGTCVVTASQAGNNLFNAAVSVSQSLTWVKDQMIITTTSLNLLPVGTTGSITASYLAALPSLNSGLTALNELVAAYSSTPTVCQVTGTNVITTAGGMPTRVMIAGLKPGICNISFTVPSAWNRTSAIATAIFAVK
jgi:hypothetical protein